MRRRPHHVDAPRAKYRHSRLSRPRGRARGAEGRWRKRYGRAAQSATCCGRPAASIARRRPTARCHRSATPSKAKSSSPSRTAPGATTGLTQVVAEDIRAETCVQDFVGSAPLDCRRRQPPARRLGRRKTAVGVHRCASSARTSIWLALRKGCQPYSAGRWTIRARPSDVTR
jgi:hypothetical protein